LFKTVDSSLFKELIWNKLWDFERACNSISFGSDILKKLYLIELVVYINKVFIETFGDDASSRINSNEKTDEIIKYIADNISSDLTLDHLSSVFYISKYHLVRLFKRYTGFTVHKYILEKRLVLAKSLLRDGKSVSETSLSCGFKDYSNFVRTFKRSFGVSPKRYSKQMMK
jgi:AraC-like DNA-binding protein